MRRKSGNVYTPSAWLQKYWEKQPTMATKNVNESKFEPTKYALQGEDALRAYLDDPANFASVKTPKGKVEMKRRNLTLSTNVNETLYVAAVNYAADNPNDPGGLKDGDLASGFLTRANRYAMSSLYMPDFDFWPWQRQEVARVSAERSERMSGIASQLGVTREEVASKVSLLEKLLSNPKLRAAALADADEPTRELIELIGSDNEA